MNIDSKIILDRLSRALQAQGVALTRNQLLAVAADAYGFRNANAFSAAARAGEFTPPTADVVGHTESGLTVLMDPIAGAPFALDPAREDARADRWGVSPYGNVLDISKAPRTGADTTALTVHTATISHRHGTNFYVALTQTALDAEIAGYCEECWSEAVERNAGLPADVADICDEDDVSDLYFGTIKDEYVEKGRMEMAVTPATARTIGRKRAAGWVIRRTDLESEDSVLWWNDQDGYGELGSATVYPDRSGRLPDVGMEQSVVWVEMPGPAAAITAHRSSAAVQVEEWTTSTGREDDEDFIRAFPRIEASAGVKFSHVEFHDASTKGRRVALTSDMPADAAAFDHWLASRKEVLNAAGAETKMSGPYPVVTFTDDRWLHLAVNPRAWAEAMRYLLTGGEGPVMATFQAESYIRDNAVAVDPLGDTRYDVTFELLLMGRDAALGLQNSDADDLKEAIMAHAWIRDWSGPFDVYVSDALEQAVEDGVIFADVQRV